MIRRIDFWIGTQLFHPPIIWICRRLGMTQYAFSGYAWLAATFTLVMRMRFGANLGETIFAIGVSLLALVQSVVLALYPDIRRGSALAFRLLVWAFLFLDGATSAASYFGTGQLAGGWASAWDVLALAGEYAKTISKIPPLPKPDPQAGALERPI